jgi:hypothetical protein
LSLHKLKAPPTRLARVVASVAGGPNGSFTLGNLSGGSYALCAQTTVSGWLDPCHFAAVVPQVNLDQGRSLSGVRIVMAKGAILQVRIDDPGAVCPRRRRRLRGGTSTALNVKVVGKN